MEPNLVGEDIGSSSIGYAVYLMRLNNNGPCGKNGGVMMCPTLNALHNTENQIASCPKHLTIIDKMSGIDFPGFSSVMPCTLVTNSDVGSESAER
ncbi:hypothetical protein ACTXT7_013875 [Hymenolepis weldensis]